MTTTDPSKPEPGGTDTGLPDETRKTRGIRFTQSEWDEIKAAALGRDVAAAEFVRMACLDAARAGREVDAQSGTADLAPLVERTFRYAYMLATLKRDELVNDGRGDEVERLIWAARGIQDGLRKGRPAKD